MYFCRNLTQSLNNLKLDMADLTHQVEEKLIQTARKSIDELQAEISRIPNAPMVIHAEEAKKRLQTGEENKKEMSANGSRRQIEVGNDSESIVKQAYL